VLKEISLHILDIAENSVNAGATRIEILVAEDLRKDELVIKIKDNGRGMDAETVKAITDPFVTSRTTRKVGLGIPFLKMAADACDGSFKITSGVGKGTEITATFRRSHIDRMPLGDIKGTFLTLLIGYPHVNWCFRYRFNDRVFEFDDKQVKSALDGIPLSDPQVLMYLRNSISEGIDKITSQNKSSVFQEMK